MRIELKRILWLLITFIALFQVSPSEIIRAQHNDCTTTIDELRSAIASCDILDSNSACYGNDPAFVSPSDVDFNSPGQQLPVTALKKIDTDLTAGAVLMLLYVEGEDTPITIILFGNSTLTPVGSATDSFILQNGEDSDLCPQTPSGMVVRTETGRLGSLKVNGVKIDLKSTAYIAMTSDSSMVIANLEGNVTVTVGGQSQELPVGYQSQVIQIGTGQSTLVVPPVPSPLYDSTVAQWLATAPDGLRQVVPSGSACGGNIGFGETVTSRIPTSSGECRYTFCSLEGKTATINLESVGASFDPWVALQGPTGTLLKYNNDISQQNINSRICHATLPVVGCYAIVARSNSGSTGAFRLTLNDQSTCAQPEPRCEVIVSALNQREEPSLESTIIRTLPQGTQLRPMESSTDGQWTRALVAGTSLAGWVNTDPQLLNCEQIPPPLTTPSPPITPVPLTATPTNTPTNTPEPRTATDTSTATPTGTPTNTPTDTSTATPTGTPTNTPTDTSTPTPTGTPMNTPTDTSTATPTGTPTNTPTDTSTPTPTGTPTDTSTPPPTVPPPSKTGPFGAP